jgi:hypothetical protein
MKITFSYLLTLSMLSHSIWQSLILINFEINRKIIAETLCIKRNEIKSNCKGNCYLVKELNKAEDDNDKSLPNLQQKQLELFSSFENQKFKKLSYQLISNNNFHSSKFCISNGYLNEVFKPPTIAC